MRLDESSWSFGDLPKLQDICNGLQAQIDAVVQSSLQQSKKAEELRRMLLSSKPTLYSLPAARLHYDS